MSAHRFRLPLAVVAVAAAAGVATLILRPRGGLIEPAAVDPAAYFSAAELGRAHDFRGLQRLLGFAGLAVSGGVLALLAVRPPAASGARSSAAPGAAARGGGGRGGAFDRARRRRPAARRLVATSAPSTSASRPRTWAAWFADVGRVGAASAPCSPRSGRRSRSRSCGASRATGGRPARRPWSCFSVLFVYVAPVVLDPIFNQFERASRRRSCAPRCWRSSKRAGVDVGEVYRVDACRRTTGANAYVNGLGADEARRALRQPDRGLSRAASCDRSSRTSSHT